MSTTQDTEPAPLAEAPAMTGETAPLTAFDRCDRCGAQAYVRVMVPRDPLTIVSSGITLPGELLFCAHHTKMHREALCEVAESIHDERDRLTMPIVSSY